MSFTKYSILIVILAFGLNLALVLAENANADVDVRDTAFIDETLHPSNKILEDFEKFGKQDYDHFEDDPDEEALQLNLQMHNDFRSRHHAGPLTRNKTLDRNAKRCAKYYIQHGKIDHTCSNIEKMGENLSRVPGARVTDSDMVKYSVTTWYEEVNKYNYSEVSHKQHLPFGHFTQVVWADSKEIGFGMYSDGHVTVGVALYSPKGNFLTHFRQNVFPK
ncbi:Cell wall protein PRY3 [Orchesella cincta]|uniref:Cell wall protein PRY3 n=1 Tax=Orchesella cincta TaxID=48709 RepID=A0A1D2ME27_ORCCI|nr:Cell wall protein PRY3 [Orchesella cincta]